MPTVRWSKAYILWYKVALSLHNTQGYTTVYLSKANTNKLYCY